MRHHNTQKKLGRRKNQRNALKRSLANSLIIHKQIKTTLTKAKALRPFIERLVTKAIKGDLPSKRIVSSRLGNVITAKELYDKIAPEYKKRNGGYTRIIKVGQRNNDAAPMAIIEFVK